MSAYQSKFNYVSQFQFRLAAANGKDTQDMVVVSPKVARDIDAMKSYISQLEKEVDDLKMQARIHGMGLVE